MEYIVCTEIELPDELKVMIDDRKEKEFHLVYENSVDCYLVAGYGRQKRDDYVVTVKEFYETDAKITLDTLLISASKANTEKSGQAGECPYIVIRCKPTKKVIVFR